MTNYFLSQKLVIIQKFSYKECRQQCSKHIIDVKYILHISPQSIIEKHRQQHPYP